MCKKMEALYNDLADYYVFDKSKYTLEEFFTDIKIFKDSFYVSKFCRIFFNKFKYTKFPQLLMQNFIKRIIKEVITPLHIIIIIY